MQAQYPPTSPKPPLNPTYMWPKAAKISTETGWNDKPIGTTPPAVVPKLNNGYASVAPNGSIASSAGAERKKTQKSPYITKKDSYGPSYNAKADKKTPGF